MTQPTPEQQQQRAERFQAVLADAGQPNLGTLPGAEILLRFLRLKERMGMFGEETLDAEEVARVGYYENRYDSDVKDWVVDPHFTVNLDCSDCFMWGTSDSEELTEENWPLFIEALHEVYPVWAKFEQEDLAAADRNQKRFTAAGKDWTTRHPDRTDQRYYTGGAYGGTEEKYVVEGQEKATHRYELGGPLAELFAAKVRQMRPQGASYSYFPVELWPFFDACGPHRVTGFGNPTEPGEYHRGPWAEYNKEHFVPQEES